MTTGSNTSDWCLVVVVVVVFVVVISSPPSKSSFSSSPSCLSAFESIPAAASMAAGGGAAASALAPPPPPPPPPPPTTTVYSNRIPDVPEAAAGSSLFHAANRPAQHAPQKDLAFQSWGPDRHRSFEIIRGEGLGFLVVIMAWFFGA